MQALLALLAGMVVGILFSAVRLPLPAPPTLSGLLGVVGVYLGFQLYNVFIHFFK